MFNLSESNIFSFYCTGVDMRKGVGTLCELVRSHSLRPSDGTVYVFSNRTRTRMKLLHWERGGYVLYYKRMEAGRISRTVFSGLSDGSFRKVRWDELVLLVEGISGSVSRRKRFNIQ